MKKTSSIVWRFFDRLEDNKRCVAVLCKLCETQYKYFGNTTNLRTHLVNKHPIQWDLLQNGALDESTFRSLDDDDSTNQTTISSPPKRRKYVKSYKNDNVRYSVSVDLNNHKGSRDEAEEQTMPVIEIQRVDVLENTDTENDNADNDHLVRQMHHREPDEEWLDEEMYPPVDSYGPKRKKVIVKRNEIKREVQSPSPRTQNYVVHSSNSYQPKTDRIYIDSTKREMVSPPPRHPLYVVPSSNPCEPKKDEYSVFGEYVANKLRKFKRPQTRGNIQQLITTILWQAEYGVYDNMESVKRIILHSVQDMEVEQSSRDESQVLDSQVEQQVQMVIEGRASAHLTEEPIRIIDANSE